LAYRLLAFDGPFSFMYSKFVPLLASAGLIAFPLQNSSAIPIIYTVGTSSSVAANRSEPSLGINTALMSGTTFSLDETRQSTMGPAERFRAGRQGGGAASYGESFSFNFSKIWPNEPMLDANDFVPKDMTDTLDFSNPSTRAGLDGSASQGNGALGPTFSVDQIKFARRAVDWDSTAPTFVLADRTFTIEMALNNEVDPKDKEKSGDQVAEVAKDEDKYNGPVASVPDHGSTALLLGTAILVLGLANRRFSIR
jgi:hypothetical protein